MGVEVGGDFGDLLEDLESFVFQVDSAEADGLELAQDAGYFAGFATQAPLAGEACADPVVDRRGRALILDIWLSERLRRSERCGGESFVSKHNSILDEYTILTSQMVYIEYQSGV